MSKGKIHVSIGHWLSVCGRDLMDEDGGGGAITVEAVTEALVDQNFDGLESLPENLCDDCLRRVHRAWAGLRRGLGWIK